MTPSPPRLRLTSLRQLCGHHFVEQSVSFRSIAELTNPQCSPESRVKTEPTWTNTGTSFPTAGGLEPTRRSQWVLRNAYGKARLSAKETVRDLWPQPCSFIGKYWRLRWHILLLLLLHPTAIQLFCISFALYWALSLSLSLSDWTVHYTNVQGKNTAFTLYIFLKYIQSKISYWYFHELQPVCPSPVHLHLLTCMYERTGVQISVRHTRASAHTLTQESMVFYRWLLIWL